jgi:hypothetical protein
MRSGWRWLLVLAVAVLIPACGSKGDTFILNVLPVPTTGTILYVGPGNVLINVSPAAPNVILSAIGLKSLQGGENLLALDYQASTGDLFAIGSSSRLYRIDPRTGECSQVSGFAIPAGTEFGMDVDPVGNRIRVLTNADENFSLDPLGGPQTVDGALNPANPNIVACAYLAAGTLYAIDSVTDGLVTVNPVTGAVSAVGPLGVDTSGAAGFDITPANLAYGALEVGGLTGLYQVNLATGAALLQGTLGTGGPIRGFTLVP